MAIVHSIQAEEFQTVVTIMREFLPEAEGQLKFRSLPNDDVVIAQMIERHQVLTGACVACLLFVLHCSPWILFL